jgi:hypothetical protein
MAASILSRFLFFVVAFSVAACLPVPAQISGVPPSVTSIGFGGRFINGVRPSVTSLGPNGFGNDWSVFGDCCPNFFWPTNPSLPLTPDDHRHHHHANQGPLAVGVLAPAYVPRAQEPDDDSADADSDYSFVPPALANHTGNHDLEVKVEAHAAEDVNAQPSTVLVFKDGHQSDVLNYAIVGDTLFDFAAGRSQRIPLAILDLPATRKANDDRGVDFQIPDSTIP